MAATEVQEFRESWTQGPVSGLRTIPHLTRTTGWDEERRTRRDNVLRWRLSLVAHAWVELRIQQAKSEFAKPRRPLIVPDVQPKTRPGRPTLTPSLADPDPELPLSIPHDPTESGAFAQSRVPTSDGSCVNAPSSPRDSEQRRRQDDDLLAGPQAAVNVDFASEEGFYQAAKKKKAAQKAAAKMKWDDDDDGTKKDGGDGGDGDGNNGGGDTGGGDAGGAGDGGNGNGDEKKDDEKKDEPEANPDDEWGDFAPVSTKKKKGKKGAVAAAAPDPPPSDDKKEIPRPKRSPRTRP
ncbi:hypothetical protein BR93DRAFT_56466 [Coniochaeta sp. PMI_546]|nr:hypothetical protein BR93DRAFT_56466 [Coniochaeta sp. PMI_546]